jgi:DHA3 family tetracycline resistance protein-like MFS transporter
MVHPVMTHTERTYYLLFGLYCFSWSVLAPMYALFLLSRGLDLFQMSVVPAIYFITTVLFEVPTGAAADLLGRRLSFLLSCVIRTVAFGLYAFAHGFVDCAIAELVDALGSTLATGALDAWAVDGTEAEGNRQPAANFFARAHMVARPLMIASALLSGYLAQRDLALPWFVGAAGFALTAVCAAILMRETRPAPTRSWVGMHRSVVQTVREGVDTVRHTPVLLLLCVLTMAGAFGAIPVTLLWQPRIHNLSGQGPWLLGWVAALLNLSGFVASALIPRLLGRATRERVLCAASLWRAGMFALVAVATGVGPALVGVVLQEMSFGLTEPLLQAWMNEHIAPERRATILSVRAMSFTLGAAGGLVCIGWLAREAGMTVAWTASASVFALIAAGFILLGRLTRHAGRFEPQTLAAKVVPGV